MIFAVASLLKYLLDPTLERLSVHFKCLLYFFLIDLFDTDKKMSQGDCAVVSYVGLEKRQNTAKFARMLCLRDAIYMKTNAESNLAKCLVDGKSHILFCLRTCILPPPRDGWCKGTIPFKIKHPVHNMRI